MMAMVAKNRFGFVDGSIVKPPIGGPSLHGWVRLLSWMLNSVSKDIANGIIFTNNATDMWKDLHERYSQSNGLRIFQLQKSI
jgi:hypothetical protein